MEKLNPYSFIKKTSDFLSEEIDQIKKGVDLALFQVVDKSQLNQFGIDVTEMEGLEDFISLQAYINWKSYLLASQETIDGVPGKTDNDIIFDILADTQDFLGRKLLFEHYIDEKFNDIKVFDSINYTPLIDFIFKEFHKSGDSSIAELLSTISTTAHNKHEISLVFHFISQQLGSKNYESKQKLLYSVIHVLKQARSSGDALSKLDSSRLKKSGRITRILGEEFNNENIQKNLPIYTYIPNILSNNFGEGSQVVDVFTGILKSYKPSKLKLVQKNTKVAEKIFDDASKVSYFDKIILGYKKISKKVKKMTGYTIAMKYWGEVKEVFGKFKMDSIIALKQKYKSDDLDFIDTETHAEIMQKYLYLIKILKSINSSIITSPEGITKKNQSQIYSHVKGRIKGKAFSPVINKTWPLLARFKFINKVIKNSKFLKLKAVWFIVMYKILNRGIDAIGNTDIIKRYKLNTSLNQGYNIEASPELFNFLIENSDKIHQIDFRIGQVRKIRLLNTKKQELENKLETSLGSADQVTQKDISLIKLEISNLESETKNYNIQQDILVLKTEFLRLLENSSKSLHEKF